MHRSQSEEPPSIAAIILTKNEERDLPDCLRSLKDLSAEVHVIDSGSTDRTLLIAREYGANIHEHGFVNYAQQFNWAIDTVDTRASWILRIDADERISASLAAGLRNMMPSLNRDITGLEFSRRLQFLGRTIRWGDSYPVWLLRMWRRGTARCEETWMDEHMLLLTGSTLRISGDLLHVIPKDLNDWIAKHNWYASRECRDILASQTRLSGVGQDNYLNGQAAIKRWVKRNVYLRTPILLRAFLYWLYRYFLRLGFLDGKEGFIYHFLHAFWYRLLVDAKLYEVRKAGSRDQFGHATLGRASN